MGLGATQPHGQSSAQGSIQFHLFNLTCVQVHPFVNDTWWQYLSCESSAVQQLAAGALELSLKPPEPWILLTQT